MSEMTHTMTDPMTQQRLDEIKARCEAYVNAHGNDTKDWCFKEEQNGK